MQLLRSLAEVGELTSVPPLHSKTCLLAVLYVPYGHHGPPISSDEPLTPEIHLYEMPTFRPCGSHSIVGE